MNRGAALLAFAFGLTTGALVVGVGDHRNPTPKPTPRPTPTRQRIVWDQPDECVRMKHGHRVRYPDTSDGLTIWTCDDGHLLIVRWKDGF